MQKKDLQPFDNKGNFLHISLIVIMIIMKMAENYRKEQIISCIFAIFLQRNMIN